jgi:hypothetical protein
MISFMVSPVGDMGDPGGLLPALRAPSDIIRAAIAKNAGQRRGRRVGAR